MCVWGWVGGGGGAAAGNTFLSTFMKHIQFCILIGNERANSSQDIPGMCIDCIHLTIIFNQCCVLVILMQEIFPKEKGN